MQEREPEDGNLTDEGNLDSRGPDQSDIFEHLSITAAELPSLKEINCLEANPVWVREILRKLLEIAASEGGKRLIAQLLGDSASDDEETDITIEAPCTSKETKTFRAKGKASRSLPNELVKNPRLLAHFRNDLVEKEAPAKALKNALQAFRDYADKIQCAHPCKKLTLHGEPELSRPTVFLIRDVGLFSTTLYAEAEAKITGTIECKR